MSLSKEALLQLEKNFKAGDVVFGVDHGAIILPDGFRIESTEYLNAERDQFRGKFDTHRIEDFAAYANNQKGEPPVFVDQDSMSATTIFDMGDVDHPLHCRHKATVRMKPTPEYVYLLGAIVDKEMNQQQFAEFLEDYNNILACGETDGGELPIKKAISAVRRVTVERTAKQESDVQSYTSKQSAMEQIEAKSGDNQLPAFIVMSTPLYYGLSAYPIKMRVSLLPRAEPVFKVRAINLDKVLETCAEEFKALIDKGVDAGIVYIGNIDPR